MNHEQEMLMVEGIKILIENCNPLITRDKEDWLNKYEDVFNPPKFGEETQSKRNVN